MNYRKIYMKIVLNAKDEERHGLRKRKNGTIYELHHIFPKSLFPQYEKIKSNKVLLTLREHYFCHLLLIKIFPSTEMYAALCFMSEDKKHGEPFISSRMFEKMKLAKRETSSKGGRVTAKRWTDEERKKASEKKKQWYKDHPEYKKNRVGKHWKLSEETKEKMRIAANTPERKKASIEGGRKGGFIANKNKRRSSSGYKCSEAHNRAVSEARKGCHWFNNGITQVFAKECPKGFIKGKLKVQHMSAESDN